MYFGTFFHAQNTKTRELGPIFSDRSHLNSSSDTGSRNGMLDMREKIRKHILIYCQIKISFGQFQVVNERYFDDFWKFYLVENLYYEWPQNSRGQEAIKELNIDSKSILEIIDMSLADPVSW